MSTRRTSKLPWLLSLLLLLVSAPAGVLAQVDPDDEEVVDPGLESVRQPLSADFKGSVGGGLIGAELGFMLPALLGARETWQFIVFPIVGAGAGVVAGYFALERGEGHPELAMTVLVTGMALVVPATVVTLAAVAYEPETEVPLRSATRTISDAKAAVAAGPGLVRWSTRGLLLAPPAVTLASLPARGLGSGARAWRVPLLSGVF